MEGFGPAARLAPGFWVWVPSVGVTVFRVCGGFCLRGRGGGLVGGFGSARGQMVEFPRKWHPEFAVAHKVSPNCKATRTGSRGQKSEEPA